MPVYQERKPKIVIVSMFLWYDKDNVWKKYASKLFLTVFQNEEDLPYEEEILRNPFSIKHWLRYIEFKKDAPKNGVNIIYERALKELPGRLVNIFDRRQYFVYFFYYILQIDLK